MAMKQKAEKAEEKESKEMKNKTKVMLVGLLVVALVVMAGGVAGLAAGPYGPLADTYTDRNNATGVYGGGNAMLLSASNASGTCVETTYLWFKFAIPATETTISAATLAIPLAAVGSGVVDLELRSSAETGWDELTMNWNTQPELEAEVLATVPNPGPGTEVLFIGAPLAAYLNNHKGENVTLVMRANCAGAVGTSATRMVYSKESPGGSGVELDLRGPTAVHLNSLVAHHSSLPVTILLVTLLLFVIILAEVLRQRRDWRIKG